MRNTSWAIVLFAAVGITPLPVRSARADLPLRVASYNIFFLKSTISAQREANIRAVLGQIQADVIGLQEIEDRAALERVFNPTGWHLLIDDDSDDPQDVAVAVRKPLRIFHRNGTEFTGDMDVEDADFLFPSSQLNDPFPNRRDVLCILVKSSSGVDGTFVMVNHWKARSGGRNTTDPRREEAARRLMHELEQQFDGKNYVLVGDFNDNPDDRSMNILESGIPSSVGGPEQIDGPLLVNLMEPLVTADIVSWGTELDSMGGLSTTVPGSRNVNNSTRGTGGTISPILFDQILFPLHMSDQYVPASVKVFDDPVARTGSGSSVQASDHLAVFADFILTGTADDGTAPGMPPAAVAGVSIAELMVNPNGEDAGNEWVVLKNSTNAAVDLTGWKLRDRSENELPLTGSFAAGQTLKVTDPNGAMPLNNGGDELVLLNKDGTEVHRFRYLKSDVRPGEAVRVPRA